MGQDELVSKIPGSTTTSRAAMITSSPAQRPTRGSGLKDKDVTEDTGGMNADSSVSPGLSSAMRVASRKIGNKKPLKTHSRESSGASVKFVNCSSSAESNVAREYRQHRRNHSKSSGCASGTEGEDEDTESHVIILSPSEHEAGSQLSDRILIKSVGCEDEDMMSTGEELSVPSTDEELEEEEGYVERTRRKNMRGEDGCKPGEMLKSNYHSRKRTNQRRKSPWPPSPPELETRREDW